MTSGPVPMLYSRTYRMEIKPMKTISRSIDVHTHAFHPKIAQKAIEQLAGHYGVEMAHNGLVEDLLEKMDDAGIERAFVHSAATKAEQVIPANNWAIHLQKTYTRLLAFGTIHPEFTDFEQELLRLEAQGIRGIKLHPDFQGFWLNDPRLRPMFECIGTRFLLMVHIGDVHPPEKNPTCPSKLAKVLKDFPNLSVIAAHFGGYQHWDYVLDALVGHRVYLDTSSSLAFLEQGLLERIFHAFPREQILFGSDYPMWTPRAERESLQQRLHLSDNELEEILTNGSRLLAED